MDIKKLAVRTLSGLVYCALIVLCLISAPEGALGLAILLSLLGCVEFSKITRELTPRRLPVILLDIAGCVLLCFGYLLYPLILWLAVMVFRFVEELYIKSPTPLRDLAVSVLSQLYIGVPMGIMAAIGYLYDPRIVLALFFFLWINDTGAFLTGSLFGRHKMFERISPKKTWEGFFGGLVFTVGLSLLFGFFCNDWFGLSGIGAGIGTWIGYGVVASVFGTWGDLVESMFKRDLGIKDSGNMIPGHGGILDRIDSFLLAMPAAAIYLLLMQTIINY